MFDRTFNVCIHTLYNYVQSRKRCTNKEPMEKQLSLTLINIDTYLKWVTRFQ